MAEDTAPAAETPATKTAKTKRPLPPGVEKQLADLRARLRAPGTNMGLAIVRLDTMLRDGQELLDKCVSDAVIGEVLGEKVTVPIRADLEVVLRVQVGDGEVRVHPFMLTPSGGSPCCETPTPEAPPKAP